MKIRSISHVGLTVTSFEEAIRWYHKHFGLMLISELTIDKEQIESLESLYGLKDTSVRIGFLRAPRGTIIEIFQFQKQLSGSQVPWNKPGYTHITFDVRHVKKVYKRLQKAGISFLCEPQENGGAEWVFLRDPDGNLIELIDMKMNYPIIRVLGGLAGWFMKKNKYRSYYDA